MTEIPIKNKALATWSQTGGPVGAATFNDETATDTAVSFTTNGIYELTLNTCGSTELISGERTTGRIAGGGVYETNEFVIYKSTSGNVADVPFGEGGNLETSVSGLTGHGKIVYWKEKKR